jgi:hypothetical protein
MVNTSSNGDSPEPDLEPIGPGIQSSAFEVLRRFLEEDNWYPQQLEDSTICRVHFSGRNGELRCYAQVRDDLDQFVFYAVAPVKAPDHARNAVAEFITRANYGLRIGNFELDFSDGEVRYKSSLDYENAALTPALLRNAIYPAVQTMDRYLRGLLEVIYGGKAPAEAIKEIEGAEE